MQEKIYIYPRVVQIMPCENMWFRYICDKTDNFYYKRVPCLALVENESRRGIITEVVYIDSNYLGFFCEEPDNESVWYCKFDLSYLTHPLSDERDPNEIMASSDYI